MPRSGTTSSRGCWHGPWWPPWPSTGLDDVLVVSPDREVLHPRGRARGPHPAPAVARPQRRPPRGRDDAMAGGADAILVLPIDLPFVSDAAIESRRSRRLVADAVAADRGARHRSPRDGDQRPRPAAARRHRLRLRPGQPRRATATGRRPSGPATSRSPSRRSAVDLDTPEDLVLVESTAPERLGVG